MLPRLFLDADGTVRLLRLRLRLCSWRLITPRLRRRRAASGAGTNRRQTVGGRSAAACYVAMHVWERADADDGTDGMPGTRDAV